MCKTVEWHKFSAYAYEEYREFDKSISESAIKALKLSQASSEPSSSQGLNTSSPQASKSRILFLSASNSQASPPGRTLRGPGQQKPSSLGSTLRVVPGRHGPLRQQLGLGLEPPRLQPPAVEAPKARARKHPEFPAMDLKDDAVYLPARPPPAHPPTLHLRRQRPTSSPHSRPHSSPFAHHPHPADDIEDPTPPAIHHPPSLRLTLPRVAHGTAATRKACRPQSDWKGGGVGAVEWEWEHGGGGGSGCRGVVAGAQQEGRGESRAQRERGRGRRSPKTTSTDGYGSDDEDPDPDDGGRGQRRQQQQLGARQGQRAEREGVGRVDG
ncbi:hypothetical protein B0H14DRAFT_3545347 [Mycena olivaceomarginata]|nr:hypothetical protein B0H14DRAFT_3545347 [Mycena olivaceomarginata]